MIGARIKQARLLAGLTQEALAERLGEQGYPITKQAISKYETGKSFPSARFMLLASMILDVPSTYLTHEPDKSVEWVAYRRRSQLSQKKQRTIQDYSRDLAELQIELQTLLYPKANYDLPSFTVTTLAEAEQAAIGLREKWDLGNRPLDCLVQVAEDRGVIIIAWEDDDGKFDGLSGWCESYPIAVINTKRSSDRIRFNLAHEIGHLVMDTTDAEDDEEALAHRFGAALLVPAEHAFHELGRKRRQLDWGELMVLKRKYGLSMAAWVRRAKDLNIISEAHYTELNIELSRRNWRKEEPMRYDGDEKPLRLEQMIGRVLVEGLVSRERIERVHVNWDEPQVDEPKSKHLTASDLMAMPEEERNAVMERAFELAAEEDFEIFEANEFYEPEDLYSTA